MSEAFFEQKGHHTIFFTFIGKIIGGEINITFPEEIEEVAWIDCNLAENYMHIPIDIKGLINKKLTIPYVFRGKVVHNS